MTRKNIKVTEETFEKLKAGKPDGVTWDYYLTGLLDKANSATASSGDT
jgi:hypothetical protein